MVASTTEQRTKECICIFGHLGENFRFSSSAVRACQDIVSEVNFPSHTQHNEDSIQGHKGGERVPQCLIAPNTLSADFGAASRSRPELLMNPST